MKNNRNDLRNSNSNNTHSSKREKIIVYSLISFFSVTLVLFAAVYFYSDFYFPQKFQEQVCQSFQRGEEVSPSEVISYLKSKKIEDHQLYVRADATGNLIPLSSESAKDIISLGDRGALVQIVSILGLYRKSSCEISIEHHLVQ